MYVYIFTHLYLSRRRAFCRSRQGWGQSSKTNACEKGVWVSGPDLHTKRYIYIYIYIHIYRERESEWSGLTCEEIKYIECVWVSEWSGLTHEEVYIYRESVCVCVGEWSGLAYEEV
jgi:hypothetical protein